jgi:3-oxoacyl-[acyl-carrier-protein] synthase-3
VRAGIESVGSWLPPKEVTSVEIERRLGGLTEAGWLERATGVRCRRFAEQGTTSSALAVVALRDALSRSRFRIEEIECLIVGSVCPDFGEPATANVIQDELGMKGAGFDVNNACNGFMSALQIANSFVVSGAYRHVAIVCGEMISPFIPWHLAQHPSETLKHLGALTLGDGGGAAIVSACGDDVGILAMQSMTDPSLWREATVLGGGSMYPHDDAKHWFLSRPGRMFAAAEKYVPGLIDEVLARAGWSRDDVQLIIPHQVSTQMTEKLVEWFGRGLDMAVLTYPLLGNNAAASQLIALDAARKEGRLERGMNLLFVSCSAGFAAAVAAVRW